MDPFELSRSPYFNDVIRAAREAYEDPGPAETHRTVVADRLKFMTEFAEVLARRFAGTMKVRPRTAVSREAGIRVEAAFGEIKEALRDLARWLQDGDRERLPRACIRGRAAVNELFGAFEQLKAEEATFPVFSRSPYVQELVRVAMGVAKGEFPPEALKEKLDWMRQRHAEFRKDFSAWLNAPRENDAVEGLVPLAARALDQMAAALDEMARYFVDRNRDHLKRGCPALLESAEVLLKAQEDLVNAAVPQGATCPRCGAANPSGTRACGGCGAVLPGIAGIQAQTMEVREGGTQRRTFSHLVRLEEGAEGVLEGTVSREDFKRTVDWFAAKARQGRKQFEGLKPPDGYPSEEARRIAEETRDLMDRGSRAVVEGVERLERYCADGSREHLDAGMGRIREGADAIMKAQDRAREVGVSAD